MKFPNLFHLRDPASRPLLPKGRMGFLSTREDHKSYTVNETRKSQPPGIKEFGFSFKKLWQFTGPGLLMSIAFLDPGNIDADLISGATANYQLLWVLFLSTFIGLLLQRLALRIGTVTGKHLAELCYYEYKTVPRFLLWTMMEIAIIGSDMQEVVGSSIALYILTSRRLPLWLGCVITVGDALLFLLMENYGLRKLEMFFAVLIGIMAISFGIEFFIAEPPFAEIMKGLFIPRCEDCGPDALLHAVGIIGSCIAPHNLYLHSGLVKSRKIDRCKPKDVAEANFYFLVESSFALFVAFLINGFIISVFAKGFYGKSCSDVYETCFAAHSPFLDAFKNETSPVQGKANIYTAGVYLGCEFGILALYIWAIGLLASGESSTMSGCYAGQFTMEGMLNLQWSKWKRVLFSRCFALIPTLYVASFNDMEYYGKMNTFLNVLMSIQLPFAILPTIAFSSDREIMGDFANGVLSKIIMVLISIAIITINTFFVVVFLNELKTIWVQLMAGVFALVYIIVFAYLVAHTIASLFDADSRISKSLVVTKYLRNGDKGCSRKENSEER